jgi:hypothetical protein
MPKYGGRRYGYGRPSRRVRGYYWARSRQPGPISGCLLPLVLARNRQELWIAGPA